MPQTCPHGRITSIPIDASTLKITVISSSMLQRNRLHLIEHSHPFMHRELVRPGISTGYDSISMDNKMAKDNICTDRVNSIIQKASLWQLSYNRIISNSLQRFFVESRNMFPLFNSRRVNLRPKTT